MRRAFTMIELMVASLLLAMVVTILTMMFNQSSIAWRTGIAGVSDLHDSRVALGAFHEKTDEILPGVNGQDLKYRTVSIWDQSKDNQLVSDRACAEVQSANGNIDFTLDDARKGAAKGVPTGSSVGGKLFIVGVRSAGPDGEFETADDVTTWPEDIQ